MKLTLTVPASIAHPKTVALEADRVESILEGYTSAIKAQLPAASVGMFLIRMYSEAARLMNTASADDWRGGRFSKVAEQAAVHASKLFESDSAK